RHVDVGRQRLAAAVRNRFGNSLGRGPVDIRNNRSSAFARNTEAIGLADPVTTTCDDHDFSIQKSHKLIPHRARKQLRKLLKGYYATLCFFTQSRIALFVSSGACQKKPCDCPLRTFISAPGMRSIKTFACAI